MTARPQTRRPDNPDMPVGSALFVLDRQGAITSWNTAAVTASGYAADELCGAAFDRLFTTGAPPGDIARQHARIGRLDIAGDQGQPQPGHRPHAKAFQHMDMGMAAADEDEILSDRYALLHRVHYARAVPLAPFSHRPAEIDG